MRLELHTPERWAQILGVLCLVILILLAGKPAFTNASEPVRGIHDPGIALQVAHNVDEVDAILGPAPSPDREVMRLKQYLDFAFIAAYAALALVIAWAMRRRMRCYAIALVVFTLLTAFYDLRENLAILRLLPLSLSETTPLAIRAIRSASFVKWSLVSMALLLLGLFFLESRRWYLITLGLLDIAAGALACFGVFHNEWLPWAGALLSAGLVLSAATLKLLTHEPAS